MYNRRNKKNINVKAVHETAHNPYLATTKKSNGNTDATYSCSRSKYKLHKRMFYHNLKTKLKRKKEKKLRLFLQQKHIFFRWEHELQQFLLISFRFSLCVFGQSMKPEGLTETNLKVFFFLFFLECQLGRVTDMTPSQTN